MDDSRLGDSPYLSSPASTSCMLAIGTWWGQCTSEPQLRARIGLTSTQGLTARNATVFIGKWCTRLLVVRHWRNLDIAHPPSAIRLSMKKRPH